MRATLHLSAAVVVVVVFNVCFNVACVTARDPALHQSATGEKLGVQVNHKVLTVVERENLVDASAESKKGAFGLSIGHDVERDKHYDHVQLDQGGMPVDEEDFYAIAGDVQAARLIADQRSGLETQQMIASAVSVGGVGVTALGCVAAGGLVAMDVATPHSIGDPGFMPIAIAVGVVTIIPGIGLIFGGYGVQSAAADELKAQAAGAYQLPVERAQAAADAYNRKLPIAAR